MSFLISLSLSMSFSMNDSDFKNLQVLPKNIQSKELLGIMTDDVQDALGVNCSYCHQKSNSGPGLDYASDSLAEKKIARLMMKMTLEMNEKYFHIQNPRLGSKELVITCETCHRGKTFPD